MYQDIYKYFEVTLESFKIITNPHVGSFIRNYLEVIPFIFKWLHQLLSTKYTTILPGFI